jgi:hypothetical protein
MRLATLVLTAALVAGAAADAAAHGRGFVPFFGAVVIVPAPVAPGKNQITLPGPPQPPGASAGAHARGEPSMPSSAPVFNGGVHRGHHHPPPAPEPVPATSAGALGRAPARTGGSRSSFSSEAGVATSAGALGRAPVGTGGSSVTVRQGGGSETLWTPTDRIEAPLIIILE